MHNSELAVTLVFSLWRRREETHLQWLFLVESADLPIVLFLCLSFQHRTVSLRPWKHLPPFSAPCFLFLYAASLATPPWLCLPPRPLCIPRQ